MRTSAANTANKLEASPFITFRPVVLNDEFALQYHHETSFFGVHLKGLLNKKSVTTIDTNVRTLKVHND